MRIRRRSASRTRSTASRRTADDQRVFKRTCRESTAGKQDQRDSQTEADQRRSSVFQRSFNDLSTIIQQRSAAFQQTSVSISAEIKQQIQTAQIHKQTEQQESTQRERSGIYKRRSRETSRLEDHQVQFWKFHCQMIQSGSCTTDTQQHTRYVPERLHC